MFGLQDRIALVTGGSRGLGRSIVLDLCRDCGLVVFTYGRDRASAEEVVAQATQTGGKVRAFRADVADREAMDEVFNRLGSEHLAVDLLVNNAGINPASPLLYLAKEEWDRALAVNLTGAFLTAQLASGGMMRRGFGTIVNMTSITGMRGQPAQTAYSATKAGLIGLTKSLAWELAPHGITVNAVAPGWIDTGMAAAMPEKKRLKAVRLIHAKRFGKPEEVASAVRYLASPAGRYINGQVLTLDGGIQ